MRPDARERYRRCREEVSSLAIRAQARESVGEYRTPWRSLILVSVAYLAGTIQDVSWVQGSEHFLIRYAPSILLGMCIGAIPAERKSKAR